MRKFVILTPIHHSGFQNKTEVPSNKTKDHFKNGFELYRASRYEDAIKEFNQCEGVAGIVLRGACYKKLHQLDKAVADFTTAIQLDPEQYTLYSDRGDIFLELKEYEKCIHDYHKALQLDATEAYIYNNLGTAYHKLENFPLAIEYLSKAIKRDPNHYEIFYVNRGSAYAKLGKYSLAIEDYQTALRMNPECQVARSYLNNVYQLIDQHAPKPTFFKPPPHQGETQEVEENVIFTQNFRCGTCMGMKF